MGHTREFERIIKATFIDQTYYMFTLIRESGLPCEYSREVCPPRLYTSGDNVFDSKHVIQ